MENLIGSLTAAYTAAEVAAPGRTPQVGQIYTDPKTGKVYRFMTNGEAVNAIAAGVGCVSKGATARAVPSVIIGGAGEGELFAGVRPSGATSLAAGESGWFQIRGPNAYFASGTQTADTPVDLGSSGVIADAANDVAGAKGAFGVGRDAATSAACYVDIVKNVFGI